MAIKMRKPVLAGTGSASYADCGEASNAADSTAIHIHLQAAIKEYVIDKHLAVIEVRYG